MDAHPGVSGCLPPGAAEAVTQALARIQQGAGAAASVIFKLMMDAGAPPAVRLRAAECVFERLVAVSSWRTSRRALRHSNRPLRRTGVDEGHCLATFEAGAQNGLVETEEDRRARERLERFYQRLERRARAEQREYHRPSERQRQELAGLTIAEVLRRGRQRNRERKLSEGR